MAQPLVLHDPLLPDHDQIQFDILQGSAQYGISFDVTLAYPSGGFHLMLDAPAVNRFEPAVVSLTGAGLVGLYLIGSRRHKSRTSSRSL